MNKPILEGQSLKITEETIQEELAGKELWGDISLTEEDYQNLKLRIKTLLTANGVDIEYMCKAYPCAMTSFFIFLARYEYDTNFWGLASKELGVPLSSTEHTMIGNVTKNCFKTYGFDFSDVKEDPYVNLSPILYEAGLPPESSIDDLFYILKYDFQSLFDPQLLIDDLIQMRSYMIRKPMLRFLKRFKEQRAVDFMLEIHDAMLSVDQNRAGDSHYIGVYSAWKEKEKTKESIANRKKHEYQAMPRLSFENGKRGLCMILPRIIMTNEWVDDVEWVITSDNGIDIHKNMNVLGDEGQRFVDPMVIPIGAAREYCVYLLNNESLNEQRIIDWTVKGINNNTVICFNSNGRVISPKYLPQPYMIMIMICYLEIGRASCRERV